MLLTISLSDFFNFISNIGDFLTAFVDFIPSYLVPIFLVIIGLAGLRALIGIILGG